MICTGTTPFSAPSIFKLGLTETCLRGLVSEERWKKGVSQHTLGGIFIDMSCDVPTSDLSLNEH